jgi:hypothetical protein
MKNFTALVFILLALSHTATFAQARSRDKKSIPVEDSAINIQKDVHYRIIQNQIQLTNLQHEDYDKLAVLDLQGTVLVKKTVTTPSAVLDITMLDDGVYILQLRSSVRLKEKTIKFIIRK